MKFNDGFWNLRPGVSAVYAQEAYDVVADGDSLVITAPTRRIEARGNVLNLPVLTTTLTPVADGVIKVRIEHHTGVNPVAPLRGQRTARRRPDGRGGRRGRRHRRRPEGRHHARRARGTCPSGTATRG